ncbi:MAG TPA: zinc-dependent alcohol dehydrogenase family protein [Stellaceae bacterium]|nr:zinc-dependent alcohol dehydrogenase family protein [Stellaceae bacterium]
MKIIQFREPGPPEVMACLDVPIPTPQPGEVLVRAHSIGVGIPDTLIRSGTYNWMPPLPATPGTELSGVIEAVGPGVTARKVGQRVVASARERPHRGGHYAEYVATPADATFVLPDRVDLEQAAALANYQVGYHMLKDAAKVTSGASLLLYAAAGGMGNAVIDLARAWDLTVVGVVSTDEKARFARDLGAHHVINRRGENVAERVAALTRGRGVDFIIDPVAGPTIAGNLPLLAPMGMLVIYGGLGGRAHGDVLAEMRKHGRICPAIRSFSIHAWDDRPEERRAGMRALIDMLAAGQLHPHIHARLKLADAVEAHRRLESGDVIGKLLLQP